MAFKKPDAKKPSTALVKWDEELAKMAAETTKGYKLSQGKFLSLKGGRISYNGADVPDNTLRCVVVGAVFENQYYDEDVPYDPENPSIPLCYAFGEEDAMSPHEACREPKSEVCKECPLNQYESAQRGKGKACKNVVRLALIAESDLEDLDAAEIIYAKIPVMSVANWKAYNLRELRDGLSRPYWSVVTEISTEPDSKSQFKVVFSVGEVIEDSSLFGPVKALWEKAMKGIDFPYVQIERAAKPSPKKPVKFAKKR